MNPSERFHPDASAAARRVVMPDVLDVDDVAYWLRCSPALVRSLLKTRRIPGRRVGRRWLVTRAALLRVIESPPEPGEAPELRIVPSISSRES